jgi:hypothetical protein
VCEAGAVMGWLRKRYERARLDAFAWGVVLGGLIVAGICWICV